MATIFAIWFAIMSFIFVASCNIMIFCFFKKEQKIKQVSGKITIGVFFGLITKEEKLRLQKRVEKDSSITPGVSYKGDWELPGGGAEEKNIRKLLTLEGLFIEGAREAKEELGIDVLIHCPKEFSLYRAVFVNPKTGIEDWAFMIPIFPNQWDQTMKMERETIDVDPAELRLLADRPKGEQLLSGWGKRMCRMSLGALYAGTMKNCEKAAHMLSDIKPDWDNNEFFFSGKEYLKSLKKQLGL